jgi:hypothetical protein
MKLTPAKSLDFVAKFLDEGDAATAESAAMAIGASRTPAAFDLLRNRWERQLLPDKRRPLLLAIAMTRQPAAIDFLLERIGDDSAQPAADAVAAMAMYKHDDALTQRIGKIVRERDDLLVTQAFEKLSQ